MERIKNPNEKDFKRVEKYEKALAELKNKGPIGSLLTRPDIS